MDQQNLIELLRCHDGDIAERTPFCPDDHAIAALLDGSRGMDGWKDAQNHLAGCDYCLARLAVLQRLSDAPDPVEVPERLISEASTAGQPPRRKVMNTTPAWAAAAVVVLVVVTLLGGDLFKRDAPGSTLGPGPEGSEPSRELRSLGTEPAIPRITAPANASSVEPGALTVRWEAVPGSLYYDIRIVDEAGFLLLKDRVEQTHWNLPESLQLASGSQYFIRIDAYLAEARSVSSPHVRFSVKGTE